MGRADLISGRYFWCQNFRTPFVRDFIIYPPLPEILATPLVCVCLCVCVCVCVCVCYIDCMCFCIKLLTIAFIHFAIVTSKLTL